MTNELQKQAAALLQKLEKEKGSVKQRPTAKALMAAEPELKAEFVRQVVECFGKLGARGAKAHGTHDWFRKGKTPSAGEEVAQMMMRRRLPLDDEALTEMLKQIGGMDFITFAPILEPLVRELEKRAQAGLLPPGLRDAAARVADGLLVKDWPPATAEDCGFPRAADRKLAQRIEQLL